MDIAAERDFGLVRGATSAHIRSDLQARSDNEPGQKEPQPGGFRPKRPGDFVVSRSKIREGYSPSSRLVGGSFWAKQQYPEFFNGLLTA
jgi:hypothetical protein